MAIVDKPLRPDSMRMDRDRNTRQLKFEMVIDLGKHPGMYDEVKAHRHEGAWNTEQDFITVLGDSDRAKVLTDVRILEVNHRGESSYRIWGTCSETYTVPAYTLVNDVRGEKLHEGTDKVTLQKIYDTFEYPIRCGALTHHQTDGYRQHDWELSLRFMSNDAPRFFEFIKRHQPATYLLKEIDVELKHEANQCVHFTNVTVLQVESHPLTSTRFDVTVTAIAEKCWVGGPLKSKPSSSPSAKHYPAPTSLTKERQQRTRTLHEKIEESKHRSKSFDVSDAMAAVWPAEGPLDESKRSWEDKTWPWVATGSRGPAAPVQAEPFDRPVQIKVNKIVSTGTNDYGITGASTTVTEVQVKSFEELRALIEYTEMKQPAVIGMIVGFPEDPLWQFMRYMYRRMLVTREDRRYQNT